MATSHPGVSVELELKRLKPSSELFDYYLSRMNTFIQYHDEMLIQIDSLKLVLEDDTDYKRKFIERNGEVTELRNTLNTIQICLQQERERAFLLSEENDSLRMQLLNTQRKVESLLRRIPISGYERDKILYTNTVDPLFPFPRRPHNGYGLVNDAETHSNGNSSQAAGFTDSHGAEPLTFEDSNDESETEEARVMVSDMVNHIFTLRDKIKVLKEAKQIQLMEWELEVKQLNGQVSVLTERLINVESRLVEATSQATKVGRELISKEVSWMKERNRIFVCLEKVHNLIKTMPVKKQSSSTSREMDIRMVEQLTKRDQTLDFWRKHCKSLEKDLEKKTLERRDTESSYKSKVAKLCKYIDYLQQKLKDESERRRSDTEGSIWSIRMQKVRVDGLEKSLKATSSMKLPYE